MADVWVDRSSRINNVSIQSLTSRAGYTKFGIDHNEVEEAVADLVTFVDKYSTDVIVAVSSIFVLLVARRFRLRIPSMLQFAENYLVSGDKKPCTAALMMLLRNYYGDEVVREEEVQLSEAYNVTELAKMSDEQFADWTEKRRQIKVFMPVDRSS